MYFPSHREEVNQQLYACTDRKEGGVGDLNYPLVSDLKREISKKYNVLTDDGVALRGLFIIDKEVSYTALHMLICGAHSPILPLVGCWALL